MGKLGFLRSRSKAKKGYYEVRNPSKYLGNPQKVIYRSSWELVVCNWCDGSVEVEAWGSEEIFVPYKGVGNRSHKYYIDFIIRMKGGLTLLVEVKPKHQVTLPVKKVVGTSGTIRRTVHRRALSTYGKNIRKWDAAERYAVRHGMKFEIWTQDKLKQMGLL